MHAVALPGRRPWTVAGLAVLVVTAAALGRLILGAGVPAAQSAYPQHVVPRTVTIAAPVTQLSVQSYGGPVQIVAAAVSHVRVSEAISTDGPAGPVAAVQQSMSGGRLSLSDPACASSGCRVAFAITVPPGVTVTASTGGAVLEVSGVAGAVLDSGGGPVQAGQIDGPLTVTSEGGAVTLGIAAQLSGIAPSPGSGPLSLPSSAAIPSAAGPLSPSPTSAGAAGVTGPLTVDTGGGPLIAGGITSATATVSTDGGLARIGFAAPPRRVQVRTGGGPAVLTVPGGPYALTSSGGTGPQQVGIATDPAAGRSLTVSTAGGPLMIQP